MSKKSTNIEKNHKKTDISSFSSIWNIIQLKDCLLTKSRICEKPKHAFKSIGIRSHGKGTFLKEDFDPDKIALKKLYKVKANDLIVNITFAWEGAIAIVRKGDDGALVSHRFPTYEINKNIILPEFLQFLIIQKWFVGELIKISPGSAGRNRVLKKADFLKINIPKPSLLEQKNISKILGKLRKSIEKINNVIQNTVKLKKSIIHHLFTYGPVPIDQRESVELQETELGLLPKAWEVKKIKDVSELIMGQSPPGSSYNDIGDGIPFLQGKAEFGRISPTHIKYTTDPKKIAKKDSVLMSVRAPVGDVNIANIDYCIGRGLASISLKNGNNIYLFFTLGFYKELLEKEGTGSTFKAINKSNLSNFIIPYPNLTIQNEIARILQTLDEKIEAEINKKNSLEELFRTLLEKLMTGQIRVNDLDLEDIQT